MVDKCDQEESDVEAAWHQLAASLNKLYSNTGDFAIHYEDQLNLGESIFCDFCNLDIALRQCDKTVAQTAENFMAPVIKAIRDHEEWIEHFIRYFGRHEMYSDDAEALVRRVRSGIQFFAKDFAGISEELDQVLTCGYFKEEVDELSGNDMLPRLSSDLKR